MTARSHAICKHVLDIRAHLSFLQLPEYHAFAAALAQKSKMTVLTHVLTLTRSTLASCWSPAHLEVQ